MNSLKEDLASDLQSLLQLKSYLDQLVPALEDQPGNYIDVLAQITKD